MAKVAFLAHCLLNQNAKCLGGAKRPAMWEPVIDLLQERGWSRDQAYVLCSVAADLRISNVVDVPNYVVSALIPEAIFTG